MSTNERYGTIIWTAVQSLDVKAIENGTSYWLSASEIAKEGSVSVPTARKYLAELVSQGYVAKIGNNRTSLYALVKTL